MTSTLEKIDIRKAEFLFGAPHLKAIRSINLTEVAVIGRSNVGKSTFINRLCRRKQLAHVSGSPGSTRELNYYQLEGLADDRSFKIALVDMPGFGYAKLSKAEREHISELSVSFLRDRRRLKLVILLNDCRRTPGEDERAVQHLCAEEGLHCLVVLTKLDTLRANEKTKMIKAVASGYHLEPKDLVVTGEGMRVEPIWERILPLL